MANLELKIPMKSNTIFNVGSVSKQFTAACILLLEEQGKLNCEDDIHKYIPELPDFGHKISLNHLISHTSGIPDHLEVLGLKSSFTRKRLNFDYVLSFLNRAPQLSFVPGERLAYCNTGYMLLAMMVERISKMSLQNFANQQIFKPLQMNSASFKLHEADGMPDKTRSYFPKGKGFKVHRRPQPNAMGATGVFASLQDMALWQENFKHNILGKKSQSLIQKMETPFMLNDGFSAHYGGGLLLKQYKNYDCVEHSGGWNSFLMQIRRVPERDLSVMVASNSIANSPFAICDEISDLLLPQKTTQHIEKQVFTNYKNLEGTYIDANNVVRKIVFSNDSLNIISFFNAKKCFATLYFQKAEQDTTLLFLDHEGKEVKFKTSKNGDIKGFYWEGGHYFPYRRFYEKLGDSTPTKNLASHYESTAYRQKINIKYRKKTNALRLLPVFFKGYALEKIGGDVYKVKEEPIYLRFSKDELLLGNEWVFGLKMKKK